MASEGLIPVVVVVFRHRAGGPYRRPRRGPSPLEGATCGVPVVGRAAHAGRDVRGDGAARRAKTVETGTPPGYRRGGGGSLQAAQPPQQLDDALRVLENLLQRRVVTAEDPSPQLGGSGAVRE